MSDETVPEPKVDPTEWPEEAEVDDLTDDEDEIETPDLEALNTRLLDSLKEFEAGEVAEHEDEVSGTGADY